MVIGFSLLTYRQLFFLYSNILVVFRLFTFKTIYRLLDQAGYKILQHKGLPAPFHLAIGLNPVSKFMLKLNELFIRILPKLFSYQIILIATPLPTPEALLKSTDKNFPPSGF